MATKLEADEQQDSLPGQAAAGSRWLRRKGNISPFGLTILAFLACVPLVMVFARLTAYPGMTSGLIGLDVFRHLGSFLNQSLTLEWIPPSDRWAVLYLLLLPTAALLISVARLTLGLRVLGFRAILIAVGFQEIGVLPSLVLMGVVAVTIILIRPTMRQIRLPLYARVSAILSIASIMMVTALFVGPWIRSEMFWNVAFFPVIILAMVAEGIAKTMDSDNALTAVWRAGWTVALALAIAGLSQLPSLRDFALSFPELMVTQLVAIVFVSEFFDLRLLQGWQTELSRSRRKAKKESNEGFRIAVVHNRWNTGVIGRMGTPAGNGGRTQSVQAPTDALRGSGFVVKVLEGDMTLLRELRAFMPPNPQTGAPGGLVLNLANGIQGVGKLCHVPAMLELAGVAYAGPNPLGHARVNDRYVLLTLLAQAGIPVCRFRLASNEQKESERLQYPLVVRPRHENDGEVDLVKNRRQLNAAIQKVIQRYSQDALIEEFLDGEEIRVGLLGNGPVECLPLLQVNMEGNDRTCPALIDEALADQIRAMARQAYVVAGCRDYARIDIRLTPSREPRVVRVGSLGLLAREGSMSQAAAVAGYSYVELLRRIVEIAWLRSNEISDAASVSVESGVLPLPQPRSEEAACR